jgi:hypothetical protein
VSTLIVGPNVRITIVLIHHRPIVDVARRLYYYRATATAGRRRGRGGPRYLISIITMLCGGSRSPTTVVVGPVTLSIITNDMVVT